MYKPLHEKIRRSRKHAAASSWASNVWFLLLPHTDCDGRFPASPELVKSTAFPLRRERHVQVSQALQELAQVGLIHLYDSSGEQYLVYHDHAQWVKKMKGAKPEFPTPPPDLCRCCRLQPKQKEGEQGEDSPTHSLPFVVAVQEGLERVSGKPGGSIAPGDPVRLVAARAFKMLNGGKRSAAELADHFVSLENSGATAEFVTAEIPKVLGEAAWACCDRVREAWKVADTRRQDADRVVQARRPEPDPPPATIAQLEKTRAAMVTARAKGLQVGKALEDLDRQLEQLRAAEGARA